MRGEPAQEEQVEREAGGGDQRDSRALYRRRLPQAHDRLVGERDDDDEHRAGVDERRHHLGAAEAVRMARRRRPARHPRGRGAEPERGAIGEHVTRVGKERERSGPPAAERLDHAVGNRRSRRDGERRAGARLVVMLVLVGFGMLRMHARRL